MERIRVDVCSRNTESGNPRELKSTGGRDGAVGRNVGRGGIFHIEVTGPFVESPDPPGLN